ncbi:hypothetical protein EJ04DRAFT_183730 [Polyplosphaeria fusca]|uniref:Uncharacterized protein n=1 Tax=Polyplosphaeria fusca TaxID=682080 RepID=A0A9P4V0W4_9PLEO|nr:hypothetical protein EJ04DRAFT_183730 [Polyplosphaeria fusca]
MAEDAAATTEETQITFNVKSANDKKYVVTVPSSSTVADLKTKLSASEFADVAPGRQRLIYSGRVLKDPDTLASVKIQDGHTVHLIKSAESNARQNPANQGTSSASTGTGSTPTPQVPTNLATGTGNDPLAALTGARYAGFTGLPGAGMFGPDGGMGPPPDPDQLLQMMENPMFLQQMNEAMENPAVIDMMTRSPQMRDNPMLAEILRNPEMRRMLFNPEMMRMQLQMQRAMGGGGPRFTAPGATDNTPGANATGQGAIADSNPANPTGNADPLASLFGNAGGDGAGANPFASLFGPNAFAPPPQNQNTAGADPSTSSTQPSEGQNQGTTSPTPNPFGNLFPPPAAGAGQQQANPLAEMTRNLMQNPEAMRSAMNFMNSMNQGGASPFGTPPNPNPSATPGTNNPPPNPFAGLFGSGGFGGNGFGTPPPTDNRPPEEQYETQLRQLNEMGFFDFDQNVQALRRSGGNVQGAIDHLLSGGS